jgi:16S rRNA (uracil1498-N3)-methyltransferase
MASVRLYVGHDLGPGRVLALEKGQVHYLGHVMRLGPGAVLSLFNGRDGEWRGTIEAMGRNACSVAVHDRLRTQVAEPDLWLAFAPVKRAPIDLIAAKATELGVAVLQPVLTRHTAVTRVNLGRLRANAIEASEQCGRLTVPEIRAPATLEQLIAAWPADRRLLLCDETGAAPPIAAALAGAGRAPGPWGVLAGPEGGFARSELDALRKLPFVTPATLGPRILRADTAVLAALACWQALVGDWRGEQGAPGRAQADPH